MTQTDLYLLFCGERIVKGHQQKPKTSKEAKAVVQTNNGMDSEVERNI